MNNRHALGLGIGIGTVIFAVAIQACTIASPVNVQPVEQNAAKKGDGDAGDTATESDGTQPQGGTCATNDFVKPDLSKLKACGNGKGHCFDKDKSPMASAFTECDAKQACVPDEVLKAGGDKLATCQAIIGEGGGCINMELIPEMKKRGGSVLKQESCPAGLTCTPCIDDKNARSGLCEPIGVHEKACTGGGAGGDSAAKAPDVPCCTMNGQSHGVCLSESAIPEEGKEMAKQDACAAGSVCAPKALANMEPVMCRTGILGKAFCMATCFHDMLGMIGPFALDQDTCPDDELCIPCKLMEMTGAKIPGCSLAVAPK
jgi:hypothetical protein